MIFQKKAVILCDLYFWHIMGIYFLLLRIAALFGHRKAKLLVRGQKEALQQIKAYKQNRSFEHVVWFHAASVGEFEQARPIIERLRKEQPKTPILLTFFSPSGYELRKDYSEVDLVTYLPFATKRNARAFIDTVQPAMAIFVKYEFWPAYLKELHKRGITTYSISAIFRPKQLFFLPWGKPYLKLLRCFTHIYVQDRASMDLLQAHGVEHTSVAGDTRFDRVNEIAEHAKQLPVVERFTFDAPKVIIAGSTWPQDEELLARYIEKHPDTKLVLVPHEIHDKHLHGIFQIFHGRYVRFTEATPLNIMHCRTLLIDTIGMLSSIYQYGQVAYIGGGFGVGIHNTIEAAVYGIPVLFGPNYRHFREAKGLIQAGAGFSVKNYREFEAQMDNTLADHEALGRKAREYVETELGATERIYSELFGGNV